MHVFNGWRLDVGNDVCDSSHAFRYPNDLRFEIRVGEDTRNVHPATVTSHIEDYIASLRRRDQRSLDSRCNRKIMKSSFGFRRRLILGTPRRFGNEERRHLRIDAGGINNQIVAHGILPIDIKEGSKSAAAYPIQIFQELP